MTDLATLDLARIYPKPAARSTAKALTHIDAFAEKFIGMSPFCVFATSGPDGSCDASPRGGGPGFVRVASPTEILIPDRPGNNRIDTWKNLLSGSGFIQVLFVVPGIDETLRVGGVATLTEDPRLLSQMEEFGRLPRAVLKIAVSECYFHCGKALMRAKLWSPESRVDRSVFPTLSQVTQAQTKLGTSESQTEIEARYRTEL